MPLETLRTTARGRVFTVVLEKDEEVGGFSVRCVELPQAISQGETREDALRNIQEEIELVLDYSGDKGIER